MARPEVTGRSLLGGAVGIAPELGSYSIASFCKAHGNISRATYYVWRDKGLGPRETRIAGRVLISKEDAAKWREERSAATAAFASANKEPGTPSASEAGLSITPCPPAKRTEEHDKYRD
jgi:hypothetical protein